MHSVPKRLGSRRLRVMRGGFEKFACPMFKMFRRGVLSSKPLSRTTNSVPASQTQSTRSSTRHFITTNPRTPINSGRIKIAGDGPSPRSMEAIAAIVHSNRSPNHKTGKTRLCQKVDLEDSRRMNRRNGGLTPSRRKQTPRPAGRLCPRGRTGSRGSSDPWTSSARL